MSKLRTSTEDASSLTDAAVTFTGDFGEHGIIEENNTLEKLICLTNPKIIILMYTKCAESFGRIPVFTAYQDRVRELWNGKEFCF